MESYGNDMFLSQEGHDSIDFTLLDRPSTSVASAPEFTAPLLQDSSFASLDFLDGSGIHSLGCVHRNAEEAHFHSHGSVASPPEFTAPLLRDSSCPTLDFLDGSGIESSGGVLRNAEEAHFHSHGSVASAPEFTAPLLPDSSLSSLYFLDGSGIGSLGGVLCNAEEAHFHSHGRPEHHKDMDWRKEKALHASSANMYIQGGENPEQSGPDNLQAQLSTSGNRVGDEVHDFFEQQHLSQQQVQLEQQAGQHQAQQLQQQARQQHVRQQLEQHARQQQLEQHSRQQQLLAGDKQNLGNQFSPSPYGSSMHNVPNFMHSGGLMSQRAIESHNPSLFPGNIHQFNARSMNGMFNCSPSVPGLSTEALLSQDPYLAGQTMTLMHLDPPVYGSSTSTMKDAAGQPRNLYPGSQVAVQELADTANKIPSAANHQAGKPVVRTSVLGGSALGNSRTSSLDPISAENDGKQKALGNSLFGQGFSQNFTQPSETHQGISNFPQGTTIPRNSQVQDFHLNQHHRSWTEDIGQKENFQEGPSQVLVNSNAPSEIGFYNSQPSGWHSVHSSQVVATSDSRIQNTNTGQYVHQGSYQMGNADIFGSLASKPQGIWCALVQSAIANSPSGEADQDDGRSLSLQKTEPASGDYLPFHSNPKQQSVWSEQNVPVSSPMNGVNSQLGVQSVQGLQQSGSEVGGHLESKHENIEQRKNVKIEEISDLDIFSSPKHMAVGQRKRMRTDQDALSASQNIDYKNANVDPDEDLTKFIQHLSPYSASKVTQLAEKKDAQIANLKEQVNQLTQQLQDAELRTKQLEEQPAIEKGKIDQQTLEKQQHLNPEIAKLQTLPQNEKTLKSEQEKIFQSKSDKFKSYFTLDQFKSKALEKNKSLFQQLNEFCPKIAKAESLCKQTSSLIDKGITLKFEYDDAEKTISDFLLWQDSELGKRANLPKIMERHKENVFSEWKHHLIRAEKATSKVEGIMNNVTQMVNHNLHAIKLITDCSPDQLPKVNDTDRWKQEISDKTQRIDQLQGISWNLMDTYLIEPYSQQTAIKFLSNVIDCIIPKFSDATDIAQLHKASRPEEIEKMLNICRRRTPTSTEDQ